jgi:signal transduction histidine kinase
MAGRYRVIVVSRHSAPRFGESLLRQIVDGFGEYSALGTIHLMRKNLDKAQFLRALRVLAESTDTRGLLVIIDEFDFQHLEPDDFELLLDLTEVQATTSIRVILAGLEGLPERPEPRVALTLATLEKRLLVLRLPEWSPRDLSRVVRASFSPFLAIQLPLAPNGPGGVLLIPWETNQVGLAETYVDALQHCLNQQLLIFAKVRSQISDQIVGRIRHMFKNRIGGIRTDVQDLRKAASDAEWSHRLVIDPEAAQRMIQRKGFTHDHYEVGAFLNRIEKALDSLTQIVDRISQFYRAGLLHPVQVNIVDELTKKLRTWTNTHSDVAVQERYDTLPAVVRMDLERFRESLDNILCNSSEHLPVEGDQKLLVVVEVRRDKVIVEVANNGPSDLPANPKEPYVTTSKTGGTGLGLAIVDRNIREAEGTFDLLPRRDGPGIINRIVLPNALWEVGGTNDA